MGLGGAVGVGDGLRLGTGLGDTEGVAVVGATVGLADSTVGTEVGAVVVGV